MEAADDIAYLTADAEDAIKKKIIDFNEFKQQIENSLTKTINKNESKIPKITNYFEKQITDIDKEIEEKNKKIQHTQNLKLIKTPKDKEKEIRILENEIKALSSEKEKTKQTLNNTVEKLENKINHIKGIKTALKSDETKNNYHQYIKEIRKYLIYGARFGYTHSYILHQKEDKSLLEHDDVFVKELYEELNEQLRKNVFPNRNILKIEIAARNILNFLLDTFVPAAICAELDKESKQLTIKDKSKQMEKKLLALIPSTCRKACERALEKEAKDRDDELYYKLLMVTDFISGMTDSYAHNLYLELSGNKL